MVLGVNTVFFGTLGVKIFQDNWIVSEERISRITAVGSTESMMLLAVVLVLTIPEVTSYMAFQTLIPNGDSVPHPCKEGMIWSGVGHRLPEGTGNRNPFGLFFEANNKSWTKEVCEADSDGDGFSNGHELGDPECTWRTGQIPKKPANSHPGVCEPWNSVKCRAINEWIISECQRTEFDCPAMREEGVFNLTIQLPPTLVPAQETTYACMDYLVPETGDYHMVAATPILNNTNVLHHMVLFGCRRNVPDFMYTYDPATVYECNMMPNRYCDQLITVWSFGMDGDCVHELVGFRMGNKGYRRLAIQVHWNNPFSETNHADSSGVTLYLSPKVRTQDAGILLVGAQEFDIPPGVVSHSVAGNCSPYCTNATFTDSINIVWLFNHMHYLGRSIRVEVIRGDDTIVLGEDPIFDYDSPNVHRYTNPVKVYPGDQIRTTCVYDTSSKNISTNFGEATSDEMCYAFIAYYPKNNIQDQFCLSWNSLPYCELHNGIPINGCDYSKIFRLSQNGTFPQWLVDAYGSLRANCERDACRKDTCIPVVRNMTRNPCLTGDVYKFIMGQIMDYPIVEEFHNLYTSCKTYLQTTTTEPSTISATPTVTVCEDGSQDCVGGSCIATCSFITLAVTTMKSLILSVYNTD